MTNQVENRRVKKLLRVSKHWKASWRSIKDNRQTRSRTQSNLAASVGVEAASLAATEAAAAAGAQSASLAALTRRQHTSGVRVEAATGCQVLVVKGVAFR